EVLAIFDKPDPLEGPYFEETLYVTPSRLPATVLAEVSRVTARAAEALGLREGPVHAELRVSDRRVGMLELAARSIGGLCSRALSCPFPRAIVTWASCLRAGRRQTQSSAPCARPTHACESGSSRLLGL